MSWNRPSGRHTLVPGDVPKRNVPMMCPDPGGSPGGVRAANRAELGGAGAGVVGGEDRVRACGEDAALGVGEKARRAGAAAVGQQSDGRRRPHELEEEPSGCQEAGRNRASLQRHNAHPIDQARM